VTKFGNMRINWGHCRGETIGLAQNAITGIPSLAGNASVLKVQRRHCNLESQLEREKRLSCNRQLHDESWLMLPAYK